MKQSAGCCLGPACSGSREPKPRGGWSWWTVLLSPSNYSCIFRCTHYLCWSVFAYVSVRGSSYTAWTAGGQLLCAGGVCVYVGGIHRLLFQLHCWLCKIYDLYGDQRWAWSWNPNEWVHKSASADSLCSCLFSFNRCRSSFVDSSTGIDLPSGAVDLHL